MHRKRRGDGNKNVTSLERKSTLEPAHGVHPSTVRRKNVKQQEPSYVVEERLESHTLHFPRGRHRWKMPRGILSATLAVTGGGGGGAGSGKRGGGGGGGGASYVTQTLSGRKLADICTHGHGELLIVSGAGGQGGGARMNGNPGRESSVIALNSASFSSVEEGGATLFAIRAAGGKGGKAVDGSGGAGGHPLVATHTEHSESSSSSSDRTKRRVLPVRGGAAAAASNSLALHHLLGASGQPGQDGQERIGGVGGSSGKGKGTGGLPTRGVLLVSSSSSRQTRQQPLKKKPLLETVHPPDCRDGLLAGGGGAGGSTPLSPGHACINGGNGGDGLVTIRYLTLKRRKRLV